MATKTVSILPAGTNSHTETAENVGAIATDFIANGIVGAVTNTSGVAPATGGFAANAQGTPNMTVAVSNGVAWVAGTPTAGNSQRFRVRMTASENVTISANSTGGTRYDYIYIKLDPDKLANPDLAADDVATLLVSRSTSNVTDDGTPPTYGYLIAKVTVANGASSITNANIADSRTQTGVSYVPVTSTVNAGSIYNPYKFSAYKTTGQTGISSGTKITYQTELYDTNNNFSSSTYTAPIAGFYRFKSSIYIASSISFARIDYYKNGILYRPGDAQSSSTSLDVVVSHLADMQLAANDTIEAYVAWGGGGTRDIFGVTGVPVGTTGYSLFEGSLISAT
jgi:hypothetical protein